MSRILLLLLLVSAGAHAQLALRQSDAIELKFGPLVDSADGVTAETGLTISQADVQLSKCVAGGTCAAFAQKNDTGACTHDAAGWYECALNATDTDTVGILYVSIQESGAAPYFETFAVIEEAVYDVSLLASAAPLTASAVWTNGTRTLTALDEDDTAIDINGTTIGTVSTATAVTTVNGLAAGVVNAAAIANGAIDAATFAADVDAEVLSYIVDDATRIDASELNADIDSLTFTVAGDVDANTQTIEGSDATDQVRDSVVDDATRIDASELNADVDSLVFTKASELDTNVQSVNGVTITGDGSGSPFAVRYEQQRQAIESCANDMTEREIRKMARLLTRKGLAYVGCTRT